MTAPTKTMAQFITENFVRMTCKPTDRNPNMHSSADMEHWRCTITHNGQRMVVTFSMGSGHNGAEPTLATVLDCMASDASSCDGLTFEAWCRELDYDTDSRRAEHTYRAVVRQAKALRRVFGPQFQTLLYSTERE